MKKHFQMRNSIYLIIFLLLVFASCRERIEDKEKSPVPKKAFIIPDQELVAQKAEWIDLIFHNLHKYHGFSGAVMYTERGNLIYKNGFGYSDIRAKKMINTNSAFQLASISKMFTATAIMIMYEQGLIDYDKDIRNYLPEFPYENLSCRMLLNHRSGLPRYMSLAHEKWTDKRYPLTNDDMLKLFVKYKPNTYFKPDKDFHYCNTNYAILVNIIERISNKTFNLFVEENIFTPLKMDSSFVYTMSKYAMVPAYIKQGIPGYHYKGWRPIRQRNDYLNGVMGDKGIYSTIEDMFKFEQALYMGTLVKKTTLAEAYKKGSMDTKNRDNYGFGWRIKNQMDSTVYHYGWWKGFRTFYIRDMKNEKSILILSNRSKGPGSRHFWNIIKSEKYNLWTKTSQQNTTY